MMFCLVAPKNDFAEFEIRVLKIARFLRSRLWWLQGSEVVQQRLEHVRTYYELLNMPFEASLCSAGDNTSYYRSSVFGDDVVIVAAYQTALCKFKRGSFKNTYPDDLLAPVLRAKTTKKIVLRLQCQGCKHVSQHPIKR